MAEENICMRHNNTLTAGNYINDDIEVAISRNGFKLIMVNTKMSCIVFVLRFLSL